MLINEGRLDRIARAVIGFVTLAFVPLTPWAWLGLLPLVTGVVGFCPIYRLFGWSTAHVTDARYRGERAP